ncbi:MULTISPECIES: CHAP domain-containing protein [Nocardioides]|uniref:CHAP domain-containing protein n=1 Tax=Nocardioides vastitatis TaxID=2568655 RepID=A0ABW0ZA76_9ACTN|nr:CHAP domain-containing protein [Nocardioides sp.]
MVFVMRCRGIAMRWGSSLVTSALLATLLVLSGPSAPVELPVVPSAGTTYLCSGYSGCRSAGYSDAGYGAVNHRMYWRMYSGHNCTNYVAYRMIRAGMSTARPWSGGGNASEWGKYMSRITDQTPNVGAVAWWGRYSNGSGSAGHVAYVEKVVSASEIIISEDSWGGTFHWRRIHKSSGRWPTGFIHFADKILKPTAPPTISGTPMVGTRLTGTAGSWSVRPLGFAYQWYANGVAIPRATSSAYVPTPAELGKRISFRVVAKRAGYTDGTQLTGQLAPVAKGTFDLTSPPVVTGTPYVDEVLTATAGTWAPAAPTAPRWRWYADGVLLRDHYGPKRVLTPELVGKTIKVIGVARSEGYTTAWAPRVVVGEVLMGNIEVSAPFAVTGRPRLGHLLTATPGTYTPTDATVTYQWMRDGVPIAGASQPTYRLTAADVGSRVTTQVNLTRKNYAPWTDAPSATARVTSPGIVRLATDGRRGRAVVRVRVTAPGIAPVLGKVYIRVGRWTDTVRLVDGRARVVVPQNRGERKVVARFLGSTVVPSARRAIGTVTVR